jgi:hypothetical protein
VMRYSVEAKCAIAVVNGGKLRRSSNLKLPSVEHLKKQAKELLRDFQERKSAAVERFRTYISNSTPPGAKLADAQHVIARDYGFAGWPKLKNTWNR